MSVPKLLGYRTCPASSQYKKVQFPIVLLRGLGRSGAFWLDFPEHMRQFGDVTMIDLLGTGRSPDRWGRGSIVTLASDVVHTIKEKKLWPCHLIGISLGGMVAAEVCRQTASTRQNLFSDEKLVTSLTVISSSARFTKESRISKSALVKMLFALRKQIPNHTEFANFLVSKNYLSSNPDVPLRWNTLWREEGVSRLATVRQLLSAAFFDGRSTLTNLQQPTLFITSKDDALVSWKNTPRLWETVAGAEMQLLDGVGHDIPTELPEQLSATIGNFLLRSEHLKT